MKLTLWLVTSSVLLTGTTSHRLVAAQIGQNSPVNDSEAYSVYAAILPQIPVHVTTDRKVVLQRETEIRPQCMPSNGAISADWQQVVNDFKTENSYVRLLIPEQALQLGYMVLPRSELLANSSGSYLQFSAVGFDSTKTKALVYAAFHCGPKCGGGRNYAVEKVGGIWREVNGSGITVCGWDT